MLAVALRGTDGKHVINLERRAFVMYRVKPSLSGVIAPSRTAYACRGWLSRYAAHLELRIRQELSRSLETMPLSPRRSHSASSLTGSLKALRSP